MPHALHNYSVYSRLCCLAATQDIIFFAEIGQMRQLINRSKTTTGVRIPLTGSTFRFRSHYLYTYSLCLLPSPSFSLSHVCSLSISLSLLRTAFIQQKFTLILSFFVGFAKRVSVFSAPLSLGVATEEPENSARQTLHLAFSDCLCDTKNWRKF